MKKNYRNKKKLSAHKETNIITNLSVGATFYENALIKNLVILFFFFCAFEQ